MVIEGMQKKYFARVAESEVKCPTFPKYPTPTPYHNMTGVWLSTILWQPAIHENRGTQKEFPVSISFKRNCTTSHGIFILGA